MNIMKNSGFTLIELMLTVAILAIVAAFAVPGIGDFFDRKRLVAGAEAIYSELLYARSEAIARSQNVMVSVDRDANRDWDMGMIAGAVACDPDASSNISVNACVLVIDDGDGVFTAANDNVLRRIEHEEYAGVNLIASDYDYTGGTPLIFNFLRGTANAGTIVLQSDNAAAGGSGGELRVAVNALGRVSMCSPANDASANNKVIGYPDC